MKVAVFADIHANIYALEAVLADCKEKAIDHFIVAGDLIGYYYWPQAVIRHLMNNPQVTCIRGNHEDILKETIDSPAAALIYRQKYGSCYDVCHEMLSEKEIQWLLNLPSRAEFALGGLNFSVHHGSPLGVNQYIYPNAAAEVLASCHTSADFTILGHTHYPFVHHLKDSVLLNPGSVGQPRDVGGYACYALIDLDNRDVFINRISYDVSRVVAAAKELDPKLSYLYEIMARKAS